MYIKTHAKNKRKTLGCMGKNFWWSNLLTLLTVILHYRIMVHAYRYWILLLGSASYVIMKIGLRNAKFNKLEGGGGIAKFNWMRQIQGNNFRFELSGRGGGGGLEIKGLKIWIVLEPSTPKIPRITVSCSMYLVNNNAVHVCKLFLTCCFLFKHSDWISSVGLNHFHWCCLYFLYHHCK